MTDLVTRAQIEQALKVIEEYDDGRHAGALRLMELAEQLLYQTAPGGPLLLVEREKAEEALRRKGNSIAAMMCLNNDDAQTQEALALELLGLPINGFSASTPGRSREMRIIQLWGRHAIDRATGVGGSG